jgi:hypothetical protein
MKRLLLSALLAATPLFGVAQVNFNFSIGDPDYNGQIYFDNDQQPLVMNATPIIAYPDQADIYAAPIYLRVPLYYYQNWQQYCGMYSACYVPVYFVQDNWYQQYYVPWYRNRYPYNVPKYLNRNPYNVPKYGPSVPRGGNMWRGETQPRRIDKFDLVPERR